MSVKVTLGPELAQSVARLVRDVAGDVVDIVEAIADDIVTDGQADWYKNVTRRTGRSGAGLDYRLEVRGTSVRAVVFNDAEQAQFERKKGSTAKTFVSRRYGYYVRRPGPFSRLVVGLNGAEYSAAMSYWREHGKLPEGLQAKAMRDSRGRERPIGLTKVTDNPLARDGKNLWQELVVRPSKHHIDARIDDLDRALQSSADRFSR